jgi:hypothetical protein
MLNVNQITSRLAKLPDQALKQFAQMHKDDPYTVSLAISESNRRKEIRASGQQAAQQPNVADAAIAEMDEPQQDAPPEQNSLPEQQGIGAIPAPNMQGMAGGGIVAFERGGRTGDVGATQYRNYAMDRAQELGLDPNFVNAIFTYESGYKPNAKSPTGPVGIGQLTAATGRFYGVSKKDRKDPYKNMDASLKFMVDLKKKYKGDQQKMAVAYNQGEPFLNDHLKQNSGELVPQKLSKKEPRTYLQKVGEIMSAAIPSAQAADLPQAPAQVAPQTAQTQVAPQAALPPKQTQVNPQGRFPLPARTQQGNPYTNPYTGDYQPPESRVAKPDRATVLGVVKALGTAEGIKRFGVGAVEDATIGMAGMPADLRKSSATTSNPFLRGLEALTTAMTPNADKDKYTTEDIKRRMTKANLRPEDSPDPNIRAIQTGGEFAGYLTNPIAAGRKLIGGARKGIAALESKAGSWMDELNGVKPVDALAEAQAAKAAAEAKIAAPRLAAPPRTAPVTPAGPVLREQPAAFPVSAEAQAAKEAAARQAAARAAARASEKPKGIAALEADKAAAEAAASRVAVLESAAAKEAAGGNAAAKEAAAVNEARGVIASPAEVLTRTTGKDTSNFPTVLGGETTEEQPAPVSTPDYQPPNTRGTPAPETSPAYVPDYQPPNSRGLPAPQPEEPSSPKEIIKMAKEETPKSAATKGFTSDDWLNLGFNLLAGKSQYAMENLGNAGIATLASKREREKEERAAALSASINTPESERIINRLMQEKGLDYASALELYYKNKNYIDTRMYGFNRTAEAKETAAQTGATAKVDSAEIGAGSKSDKLQQERLALYLEQMEALRKSPAYLLKQSNPVAYNEQLELINKRFPEFKNQQNAASAGVTLLGVRDK